MEDVLQSITIYHKNGNKYDRYNIKDIASVRNTSIQNRNNTGISNVDSALIRIFDIDGYNKTYFVDKNDVIVAKKVEDNIELAPLTELKNKYGDDMVYQVTSIDVFKFKDEDIKELQHIKIGAK